MPGAGPSWLGFQDRRIGQGRGIGANNGAHAARMEIDVDAAAEFPAGHALEQGRTKPPPSRRLHDGAVTFGPGELEAAVPLGCPSHLHPAGLGRKGPVFHRIGRQFVEREGEGVGAARIEEDLRPLPPGLARRQAAQLGGGDMADFRPAPAGGREQRMGRGHGLQAPGEVLQEGLYRHRLPSRLRGQRLDGSQDILHPMVEFGDQGLAFVLLGLSRRDVAHDADNPAHAPR